MGADGQGPASPMTGGQRNGRHALVPGIIALAATAVFVGCLMACSTFSQSLIVARDLVRAGCINQQVMFDDTSSQDSASGTLTLFCSGRSANDETKVPPEVLDRIIWHEAPIDFTVFDNGYSSQDDISADRLRAQLGPRPPALGMTGYRDALLYLASWIAFFVMLVSSIWIAARTRFGWSLVMLVFLVPVALLTYITRYAGGGPLLATLNLQRWLVEAMVPDKLISDIQLMIFLAVILLGSMPVVIIVVVRRRAPVRPVIWPPPGQYGPYPPPVATPWPAGAGHGGNLDRHYIHGEGPGGNEVDVEVVEGFIGWDARCLECRMASREPSGDDADHWSRSHLWTRHEIRYPHTRGIRG